jgi:hypothetical protein
MDELEKHAPQFAIIKPYKQIIQVPTEEQYCSAVSAHIEHLGKNAGYLWTQTGGKNPDPADPWLIAVSAAHGYTLVTNESPRSPARIPAACKLPKIACRCIRGPHFLYEVGIVTAFKPEHINPADFFDEAIG